MAAEAALTGSRPSFRPAWRRTSTSTAPRPWSSCGAWRSAPAYCCAVEARGCSDRAAPSYDCLAGGPWRPAQRRWCCEEKNVGCETVALKFDCGKGIRDWRQAWPSLESRV